MLLKGLPRVLSLVGNSSSSSPGGTGSSPGGAGSLLLNISSAKDDIVVRCAFKQELPLLKNNALRQTETKNGQ